MRRITPSGRLGRAMFTAILAIVLCSYLKAQTTDRVKKELFQEVHTLLKKAEAENLKLVAPESYTKGIKAYQEASDAYNKGEKIKTIQELLDEAISNLENGFQSAKVSRVALEDALKIRNQMKSIIIPERVRSDYTSAEQYYLETAVLAERGDVRAVRNRFSKLRERYMEVAIKAVKEGSLKNAENALDASKSKLGNQYKSAKSELKNVEEWINDAKDLPYEIDEFARTAEAKIDDIVNILYPDYYQNLPDTLMMGGYTLLVVSYENKGIYDFETGNVTGLNGLAEFSYACGALVLTPLPGLGQVTKVDFEVVNRVIFPERQIQLDEAYKINPKITLGEIMTMPLRLESSARADIIRAKEDLFGSLMISKGDIRVRFQDLAFTPSGSITTGNVIAGSAIYPTTPPKPEIPAQISVSGFTVNIDSLTITTSGAIAEAYLVLPASLFGANSCGDGIIHLGQVSIAPDCQLYKEMPDSLFGPYHVGNTGIVIQGQGVTVDLSDTQSPTGKAVGWRGVLLHDGQTVSEPTGTVMSNTGYAKAEYIFSDGEVSTAGLEVRLKLNGSYQFKPINPVDYLIGFDVGSLEIQESQVVSGKLGPGTIYLPTLSVCAAGSPGTQLLVSYTQLEVFKNMDIGGPVQLNSSADIGWGELTHAGNEMIAWEGGADKGYLYLHAGPLPSFSPDQNIQFIDFKLPWNPADAITCLDTTDINGVVFQNLEKMIIYSENVPGGISNPIHILNPVTCWLRVGHRGVDGECIALESLIKLDVGNDTQAGYEGNQPFKATILTSKKQRGITVQYAASGVYDSEINGFVDIPDPSGLDSLCFSDMEFTSTANLVGGDINLPVDGDTLEYWKVAIVPTGDPEQAGVISARTGRLVFTAAGISESVHFKQPFKLTWGEILADGNLGELYIDYNDYGQRFDDITFSPHYMDLSRYIAGNKDGYLATCGTAHINWFGTVFVNIQDARNDGNYSEPFYGRNVTVPKKAIDLTCEPTDLAMHGKWEDGLGKRLSEFDFLDMNMDYNTAAQNGFIGSGTAELSILHSDGLKATIEIHGDTIDICMSATETHDVDFSLASRLASIGHISGCVRITGPQMTRMSIHGYIEASATTGMDAFLTPKAAYYTEVMISVTPNEAIFATSGDMYLTVAASTVDVSGSIYIKNDFTRGSTEGEVIGRIDCNSVIGGMDGEGQLTWYADMTSQYVQGKMSLHILSWIGGAGLEGGFFLGNQCPKSKAWILYAGGEKFGISDGLLPPELTGFYGYGQLSFSVQWYVFGGGVEIYAGLGCFVDIPTGETPAFGIPGFPYILGSTGVYVHGEILGGLVSASAWGDLTLLGPVPLYFEGSFGLRGCVLWVLCASVEVTAGLDSDGFYIH
jgi:hypothetical protein